MNTTLFFPAAFFTFLTSLSGIGAAAVHQECEGKSRNGLLQKEKEMIQKVSKADKEWKDILTPERFRVLRQAGTERPFTGRYNDHYEVGVYSCGACGTPLFSSETKYDHGTGWPSFAAPLNESRLELREDHSHGMIRTEVRCAACGSHLGHVFDDGPAPTRQHYCINSIALDFQPAGQAKETPGEATETAVFAAGCFWGVEYKFGRIKGVVSTRVGYTGGHTKNPSYQEVCSDATGHAESIEVVFDPLVVSYAELVDSFFRFHDPIQVNRQWPDVGTQYRSAIFYLSDAQKEAALKAIAQLDASGRYGRPVATQVLPASEFYPAEEYHQKYYEKLRQKE